MPPTQTSVEQGSWVEYHPLTTVRDGGPIEFEISGSGEDYIDFANTVLYVKAKITANDGTNLGADAAVGPANLSAQSVFASGHVSPKLKGGYTAGGNLPLGDLMGKEEPAQGSSNGLRTIHDLA